MKARSLFVGLVLVSLCTAAAAASSACADCTPVSRPLCQKPPSPITASVRRLSIGETPARDARLMP
jgi:hypothetical protein